MSRSDNVEVNTSRVDGEEGGVIKVLLVEDNQGDTAFMREMLEASRPPRFEIVSVSRLQEALERTTEWQPDVILLDLGLPDSRGLGTLGKMVGRSLDIPIVVLTGVADEGVVAEAMKMGAQDYLVKGQVERDGLERSIRYAIQRKKAMEEIRESNRRYTSLFQDNGAVMIIVDPVTSFIVDANQAASDFYGYDLSTLRTMKITEINQLPPEQAYERMGLASSRDQNHFFFRHRLANGQVRDVEVYTGPIALHSKTLLYSIVHDITDRKRAEEERERLAREMERQSNLLKAMIDNTPAGILVLSGMTLGIKWVNGSFPQGRKRPLPVPDLIGRPLQDVIEWANGSSITALIQSVMNDQRSSVSTEMEFKDPADGNSTFWHLTVVPISSGGPLQDVMLTVVDMTEQVNARRRMEEMAARSDAERRRLKTILDSLPVGVIVADASGRTIEKNEIVDKIWGGRAPLPESIKGYRDFKAWWADTGMNVRPEEWAISRALSKGETPVGETMDILRFDGTRGTILSSASPIRDAGGRLLGGVAVMQDITRQRKLEHDAIEAKEQAELYIDLLSHDISNMNTAIAGYLQMALDKMDISEANKQYFIKPLDILENSSRLIENVRKIQQVESHESKHGLVDLGWLLEDVRMEYEHYPGRDVKIIYKPSIKRFVMGSDLLKDVFVNLVSNSIKHSVGPVEIAIVMTKAFEDGREYYKVVVEDDGPGIPDDLKVKLFQRKQRGKTKATGTGLGLYLVKKLVEESNGRVWVEDRVPGDYSKGARFAVLLPSVTTDPRSAM